MSEPKLVKIQVQLPDDVRTQFKAKCVIEGVTMNDTIIQLIKDWTTGNQVEEAKETKNANGQKAISKGLERDRPSD